MEHSQYHNESNYQYIADMATGFQNSQLLWTAIEFEIFTHIHNGTNTVATIATATNTDARAIERLLNALVALKLLNKKQEYYSNTQSATQYLVKTSKHYSGSLLHNSYLWDSWKTLPDVIKTGRCLANTPFHKKNKDFIKNYLSSYDIDIIVDKERLLNVIPLRNANSILKIGATGYQLSLEIAKKHPDIKIHILDYPEVIDVLSDILASEQQIENISFIKCNDMMDTLDNTNNYDIVFADYLLDVYSYKDSMRLLTNLYSNIANSGKLIFCMPIINDTRTFPEAATMNAITLLLNTENGDSYTFSDMWVLLKEAGFKDVEFTEVNDNLHIVLANKSYLG
ncbi:MAG: hypothetical protein LBO69_07890 [Ignavibacteria bacterium]|jgi:predicted transcriptional regulator|nr:hypothetical protein [Ignavibacteria bacterium]